MVAGGATWHGCECPALVHGYNDRNELTSTTRGGGAWRSYSYDSIGNRVEAVASGSPSLTTSYNTNVVNQYENAWIGGGEQPIPQGFVHDDDGNLREMFAVGDANCDGVVNNFNVDSFVAALSHLNDPDKPEGYGGTEACWDQRHEWGDFDGDGQFTNFDIDLFVALIGAGGSGADTIALRFEWDGENRLRCVTYPYDCGDGAPDGFERCTFAYDYLGRRVELKIETCDDPTGTWSVVKDRKFVYDGWNPILELGSGDAIVRKYTWGLDLSAQYGDASVSGLHGAGGIGGLLAVDVQAADPETPETGGFWFCYDANGNVMQLVAGVSGYGGASGDEWHADRLTARYEYDPYGKLDNTPSAFGLTNALRFSTKYRVDQIELGDWGYRWYDPRAGRWISRDLLGEHSRALYPAWHNNPLSRIDPDGRTDEEPRCRLPGGSCTRVTGNDPSEVTFIGWEDTIGWGPTTFVEVCCRDTRFREDRYLGGVKDCAARCLGVQHCWIRTSKVEAGLGDPGGARPEDNKSPCCDPTAIVEHTGQGNSASCVRVSGCNENCVNRALVIGKQMGDFGPNNNCNTLVTNVLRQCGCFRRCLRWSTTAGYRPDRPWKPLCEQWADEHYLVPNEPPPRQPFW